MQRWIMRIADKFIFWVAPESREAKLAFVLGAKTPTGFIRAVGPSAKLIGGLIDTIMNEMGLDKEATLHAIAKLWGMKVSIKKEVRRGPND